MSLINDVLKDLERRDASEASAAPRPVESRPPASLRRGWQWSLWLIAALTLGGILHLTLESRTPPEHAGQTAPLTANADPGREPASTAIAAEPSNPAPARSGETPPAGDATPESGASAGVETAAAPQTGTPRQPSVSRQSEPVPDTDGGPAQANAEETPVSEEFQAGQSEPAPNEPASVAGRQDTEEATISIRRAHGEQPDSDSLAEAKRQLSRGQVQCAEAGLRQLIDEQPGLTEAHELLASTLLRRRQHDAAVRVLENGLTQAHDPASLAALLGRLLLQRGEAAPARSVLGQHAPAMAQAPDYHLLLAAAHRQAGDHERAAEHYRELSEHLPRRGAVWIGLGASLESLDRPREAVSAYNRALDGDDDRAARFARERLTALEPITGEPQ